MFGPDGKLGAHVLLERWPDVEAVVDEGENVFALVADFQPGIAAVVAFDFLQHDFFHAFDVQAGQAPAAIGQEGRERDLGGLAGGD